MKDTIQKLSETIARVLVAGAHLAAGDAELARAREALERAGAKVPVLAQVAGMLKNATEGTDPVRELLSAATAVAQIRAAQLALAPCPPGEPLPAVPPVGTPCNTRDLYDLHDALVNTGPGREEKVRGGVERGDIADLRLVEAALQALGDGYLGEYVATHVIPPLGRAVVEPIRAELDLKGAGPHARRLRALVAVEKEGARDVLEKALHNGSSPVREAALDAIADFVRGVPAFEPLVLEIIASEKAAGVRRAAVRALAGYGSDASLEALIDAVAQESTHRAAAEALAHSTHPRVVDRLLAALDVAQGDPPKVETKPKRKKAAPVDAQRTHTLAALLTALAGHADPRIPARVEPLVPEFGAFAQRAMVRSATHAQLRALAERLLGPDRDAFEPALEAVLRLPAAESFAYLSEALTVKDRNTDDGVRRIQLVLAHVGANADPRWSDVLLGALDDKRGAARGPVMVALGRIQERRALPKIIALLEKSDDYQLWWAGRDALGLLGPESVQAVRDVVARRKPAKNAYYMSFESILEWLQRRYPGH